MTASPSTGPGNEQTAAVLATEDVPVWTDGWTAGYAAGIARALADCPTHGVCPHCREGWGHYTQHGYLPTVQSEAAPR